MFSQRGHCSLTNHTGDLYYVPLHSIPLHSTTLPSIPRHSTTFYFVPFFQGIPHSLPNNSRTAYFVTSHTIPLHSTRFYSIPQHSNKFYWVPLWQSRHHSYPNNRGTLCCATFHHVPLYTTVWHSSVPHSSTFHCIPLCQGRSHSSQTTQEQPIALVRMPMHMIPQDCAAFQTFHCVPLHSIVTKWALSLKNSQEPSIASHFTSLHSISQPSSLFRDIPPRSITVGSNGQRCMRFQFTLEPFIVSHYNRYNSIPQHYTP